MVTDHFALLKKLKKRVREITVGNIFVNIRAGEYFLSETVVFDLKDSGTEAKSVTYQNYENETPVFTSAVKITNWKKLDCDVPHLQKSIKDKVFVAEIPQNIVKVLTLFSGDVNLERCHSEFFLPAKTHEYTRVDSLNVAHESERHLLKRVDFPKGMLRNCDNVNDIELRFMPVPWTMNLLPLESVDEQNCVATLAVEATAPLCAKPDGIRVENDIRYLTKEGQWCVDHKKRLIYYIPKNESPEDNIVTPTLQEFFRIEGELRYNELVDLPVTNLHFKGLEFCYGKRDSTDKNYKGSGIQHDWEMFDKGTALVRFRGAKKCSFTQCYLHNTSGTGLRLDLTCENIDVKNNMFDSIGNMGILLCGYGPGIKNTNRNNLISNNIITRCGEEIWRGHAIFLWQSGENVIEHNKIHHCARKGIGLCGVRITILQNPEHKFDEAVKSIRWNEIKSTVIDSNDEYRKYLPYLHCRDNLVRNNEIYKVFEKIGDGSALNISGAGEGNIIEQNYLHHISTYHASSVMRVDDWQCGTTFIKNIVYKSNISGITRKNFNHIINNYLVNVNCKNGYIRFASYPNEKANYGSIIYNNICYDSGDEMEVFGSGYLVSNEATLPQNCKINNNLYFCKSSNTAVKKHMELYKKLGIEQKSVNSDPLFLNPENGDFTLADNSPAHELEIEQIDFKKIGLASDFPKTLLVKEYVCDISDEFSRGKDESKTQYNWW